MLRLIFLLLVWGTNIAADPADHNTRLTVLPGWDDPDGTRVVALRIDMAEGWKTYWRAPGDAGIPPLVQVTGSSSITNASVSWPLPKVFSQGTVRSIGYADSVTIPIRLTHRSMSQPLQLSGRIDIGVCDEICVPVRLPFDVLLPPSTRRDPAIIAAIVSRPDTATEAGASDVICTLSPIDDGLSVTAQFTLPAANQITDVVIETGNPEVWVSQPDMQINGQTITAQADMIHVDAGSFLVDRSQMRFTAFGKDMAVDLRGCKAS